MKQRIARVVTGLILGAGTYYVYKKSNISTEATPLVLYAAGAAVSFVSSFLLALGFPLLFQSMGWTSQASHSERSC